MAVVKMNNDKESFDSLIKASKVRWKNHLKKTEQMKFLQQLYKMGETQDKRNFMKMFLWRTFFPMVSWKLFSDLYNIKEIKSKRLARLDKRLLRGKTNIRGGCIFTLFAGIIASIAASASTAATAIAGGASAIAGAVASSSVATAAITGLATGAAAAVGEKIVSSI